MNGNRIPPCRPHGLHTLDPGRHASSGAPGASSRFAGVLHSSRSRSRRGGRSQRPVVAALLAALAFLLLAAPAEAQSGVPGAPTGLTATLTHLDFSLSWTAPTNPGSGPILGYRLEVPGGNPGNYYTLTTASRIIGGGNSPRDYTARVRAFNSSGNGDWSDSIGVSVRRATITIVGTPVIEGSDAVFTLTTDLVNQIRVNAQSALVANVLVSESDDMVASTNEKVHTVRFAIDATTATLTVPTVDDNRDERDSVVTAAIRPGDSQYPYTVGTPASATVRVTNDDFGNFEEKRLDSCGASSPHSQGFGIECFQLVGSRHVRTPEGMANRGYEPVGVKANYVTTLEVGDIIAMEGIPDDWVISRLGEKVTPTTVTIAAGTSPVTEKDYATFTVTRAMAGTTHLTVNVDVTETQSMIFGTGWPRYVDILANATEATLTVVTDDDRKGEPDSVITATVVAGNGYTAGTSGSASVTVEDNDGTAQPQQAGTPGAPRDFSARPAGESRIDLSWTAPAGEPTGYEIEWSADGETGWTAVDPAHAGTAAEYADEGLDGGTTRYYRVRAFNEAGEGEWSAVADATTNLHLVLEGPGAPENLSASASGASRIDLSWTAPEGEVTGYAVEWSGDGETGWAAVDPEHSGTAAEYAHTGLSANTTYYYRVLALADAVPGEWSDVAGATTDSATRQRGEPPAAPGNVSAGASGQSRIEVSWSAPKGEVTGYEVEWSADGSGSWTAADPAHSGTATGYSDTGLDAGTTRHYRVRAVNGGGLGRVVGSGERHDRAARADGAVRAGAGRARGAGQHLHPAAGVQRGGGRELPEPARPRDHGDERCGAQV